MLKRDYQLTIDEMENYKLSKAYVWLDMIRTDIENDLGRDEKVEAIKLVQKQIRIMVSGISEEL